MITIRNGNIQMFKKSGDVINKITIISALYDDQPLKTLMHLGRGRMFLSPDADALWYVLNKDITVYLWFH